MKARLRQPLFWIVAAEVLVMFVLFVVSWRVYQAHRQPAPTASLSSVAAAPAPTAVPSDPGPEAPANPAPASPRATAAPTPSGFPVNLDQVNSQQASLERLEEGIVARLVEAMRAYLETVVLPAVRRAERDSTAISPATAQSAAAITKMP
jgi:hypothetical protein